MNCGGFNLSKPVERYTTKCEFYGTSKKSSRRSLAESKQGSHVLTLQARTER